MKRRPLAPRKTHDGGVYMKTGAHRHLVPYEQVAGRMQQQFDWADMSYDEWKHLPAESKCLVLEWGTDYFSAKRTRRR